MDHLYFYTTPGCHLCEQAEQLLCQSLTAGVFQVEAVDIAESDALIERYGVRIPVLADPRSGRELDWPFDQRQLLDFLAGR